MAILNESIIRGNIYFRNANTGILGCNHQNIISVSEDKLSIVLGNDSQSIKANGDLYISGNIYVDINSDYSKIISFKNASSATNGNKNKHNCYIYRGDATSNTGIGLWDGTANAGILVYDDVKKIVTLATLGATTISNALTFNGNSFGKIYTGTDTISKYGEGLANLVISSWNGISFTTNCTNQTCTSKTAVGINCRTGDVYCNSITANKFITSATSYGTSAPSGSGVTGQLYFKIIE